MNSMFLSLALFAVAALGGLIMAARLFAEKSPPILLPILHGAFAVAGVVTLFLAVRAGGAPAYAGYALAIFIAAAIGGLYLVSFHFRRIYPPKAIILLHALVAIAGFALLAAAAFGVI